MANGIPAVEDFNDLDQNAGIAPFPVNIDGVTGSTARSGTSTREPADRIADSSTWRTQRQDIGYLTA